MPSRTIRGVFVPALTPFSADLTVDNARFLAHCEWLLDQGADGLAVFGTTSEANSLSGAERMQLLDHLIDTASRPVVLMPGTGCCALPDTVALTRHAVEHGALGVLLLPPFYYKNVSDDGVYASIAEVVQRVADPRLTHLPVSHPADGRRRLFAVGDRATAEGFPGVVVGIKDSSGRLEEYRSAAGGFSRIRGVSGQRDLSARRAAPGRRRLHLRDGQRQRGGACAHLHAMRGYGPRADRCRRSCPRCARRSRNIRWCRRTRRSSPQAQADPSWNIVRPPLARAVIRGDGRRC